jgi:hypothetical protein
MQVTREINLIDLIILDKKLGYNLLIIFLIKTILF